MNVKLNKIIIKKKTKIVKEYRVSDDEADYDEYDEYGDYDNKYH